MVAQEKYYEAIEDIRVGLHGDSYSGNRVFQLAQVLELQQERVYALQLYRLSMQEMSRDQMKFPAKAQKRIDGDWQSSQEWIDGEL